MFVMRWSQKWGLDVSSLGAQVYDGIERQGTQHTVALHRVFVQTSLHQTLVVCYCLMVCVSAMLLLIVVVCCVGVSARFVVCVLLQCLR